MGGDGVWPSLVRGWGAASPHREDRERAHGAFPALDDAGWLKLARNWAIFFVVMAIVTEIVWRNFSTDFWVSFKLFGFLPLTFLFAMVQMPVIMKHQTGTAKGGDATGTDDRTG